MPARLEIPSERFKESYLSHVAEFAARGEPLIPFPLQFPTDDFPAFLKMLADAAHGVGVPEQYVPHTTFWLVDDTEQVVAVSNLRLRLNDALKKFGGHIGYGVRPSARRRGFATLILAETLKQARRRGIAEVLITCYQGNTGSVRTILKNGGVFDSEELLEGHDDVTRRYWIRR